jgi:hypothetical protein
VELLDFSASPSPRNLVFYAKHEKTDRAAPALNFQELELEESIRFES